MTKRALLSEILRLSPEDRFDLLGDAWDAMVAQEESVPVPTWHVRELERRLAEPEPSFIEWEEVRAKLRDRKVR